MRFDEGRPRLSLRASHGAQLLVEWAKTDLVHGGRCAQAFEVQFFFFFEKTACHEFTIILIFFLPRWSTGSLGAVARGGRHGKIFFFS